MDGEIVVEPQFQIVGNFSQGLASAMLDTEDGECGYIDRKGKWKIEPIFNHAGTFSEGLANVQLLGKTKWGFIDKKGETIIPAKWDMVSPFNKGLALVRRGKSSAYIDKDGELIWSESTATKEKTASKKSEKATPTKRKQQPTKQIELLKEQLAALAKCGVTFNRELDLLETLREFPEDYLETKSFLPLSLLAGSHDLDETETNSRGWKVPKPNSEMMNTVYSLDTSGEPEDYFDIIGRATRMTSGDLKVTTLQTDEIDDKESGLPTIEVKLQVGKKKLTRKYMHGIVDTKVYCDVATWLKKTKSSKVFFQLPIDELTWLYGCLPKTQFAKLCKTTKLKFERV
jgi:hypothetical protein